MSNPPGLGPHLVGRRVVVRRVLPGSTGPSGGPAMTDVLGILEGWAAGVVTVRPATGPVVSFPVGDVVSGKPVPPRPSVRQRISPDDAEHLALASWPAAETSRLGSWVLRASGGYSSRANSVLAAGSPSVPLAPALASVVAFYAARGLPPWAQVVVDSEAHHGFESAGWLPARPGEADSLFQVASVAQARRGLPSGAGVDLSPTASAAWLADDPRALAAGPVALAVLEGPSEVCFASVLDGDTVVAKGRAACAEDWLGITNVWVSPSRRRSGLGTVVLSALLSWGAERGAATAYLQTRGDNPGALAAYDRLGFVTHHTYRYLRPPT